LNERSLAAQDVLIVVPARGGSKGLPRKNARYLGDLPLLGWTAEAIRAAGLGEATSILSTDDPEIAEIGRSVGLHTPFMRPAHLASDEATAESVALHALDWMVTARGVQASILIWLQPTSPFRLPASVRAAVEALQSPELSGVLGVKALNRSLRTLFYAEPGMALTALDANAPVTTRRQDTRTLYTPNGALYAVRSSVLRQHNTLFPAACRGIVMDDIASLDIDTPGDWSIAEALLAARLTWRDRLQS
jgi:CMP-N,N'-diacetyllegionaminic acid synthase